MPRRTTLTRRSILAGAAGLGLNPLGTPGASTSGQVQAQAKPPGGPETVVVGFPIYEGATLLDFAGATQVFAFAGSVKIRFVPTWLAARMAPVTTTGPSFRTIASRACGRSGSRSSRTNRCAAGPCAPRGPRGARP